MILAVDIGNTNIVVGCIDGEKVCFVERLSTVSTRTELEYAISFKNILELHDIHIKDLDGGIISSVVPPVTNTVRRSMEKIITHDVIVIGPGVKTGLNILMDDPKALVFLDAKLKAFVMEELTRIRRTSVQTAEVDFQDFSYTPNVQEIKGTVSSVRLDALLALAFSSSRSSLTGLIGAGKVFVNGRLTTSNGCHIREQDIISVRGMGKFRFAGQLSVTKKNRICVLIHKYI